MSRVLSTVWVLVLSDLRARNELKLTPVARATSKAALERYLARERVAPYAEENPVFVTGWSYQCVPRRWVKCFRKGGPLEWYRAPQGDPFHEMPVVVDYTEELSVLPDAEASP